MDKIKVFFSVILIFFFAFILSFFALQFAKQKGNDELFKHSNPYDLVIKNVRIIDGTGGEIYDSHIGIYKGKITRISMNLDRGNADIFDGTGFTIVPRRVELPAETDWVTRDLPGAMSRFPYYRIFFKTSEDPFLAGRSLNAVLREGIYVEEDLRTMFSWTVLVAPEGEYVSSDNIPSALYKITGWRSDALGIIDKGKIKVGYEMDGLLYRTKDISTEEFLNTLNNEIQPLEDYRINGSSIEKSEEE